MRVLLAFRLVLLLLIGSLNGQVHAQQTQSISLAGNYHRGGMFESASLKLGKSGVFEFNFGTDVVGSDFYSKGRYQIKGSWITLLPKSYKGQGKPYAWPTRLLAVRWAQRLYMVWENEILRFCNDVNLGEEPFSPDPYSDRTDWGSNYLMREGDPKRSTSGRPELPAKWQSYLLPEPLYARVTKVNRGKVFTINLGKRDGLRLGMIFTHRENNYNYDLKVVWLGETMALLKNRYEEAGKGMPPWPQARAKVGQRLSTRREEFMDVQILPQ